jgi:uncharacterized membrane protein YkoI
MKNIKQSSLAVAAVSAIAVLGVGVAGAATSTTHVRSASGVGGNSGETALTGTTLSQASAAAIAAVPGGTVGRASAENASDPSGAAYEVKVTKTDGSRVEVLEDSSFKVLSTKADVGRGPGGPGGRGPGGGNPNETVLTGTTLSQASAAAVAAVPGGTVGRASTEDKSDTSGAAYEVHVTKADGSQVEVLESSTFSVLSVSAGHQPGHGGPRPASTTTTTGA